MFITKIRSNLALNKAAQYVTALFIASLVLPPLFNAVFCIVWLIGFYVELANRQQVMRGLSRSEGYFAVLVPFQVVIAAWGFLLVFLGKAEVFMQVVCPMALFMFIWLWPAVRIVRRDKAPARSTRYVLAAIGLVMIIHQLTILRNFL